MLFKKAREVVHVGDANGSGDLPDGLGGRVEAQAGAADPRLVDVSGHSAARLFPESGGKVTFIQLHRGCKSLEGEFRVGVVDVDKADRFADRRSEAPGIEALHEEAVFAQYFAGKLVKLRQRAGRLDTDGHAAREIVQVYRVNAGALGALAAKRV